MECNHLDKYDLLTMYKYKMLITSSCKAMKMSLSDSYHNIYTFTPCKAINYVFTLTPQKGIAMQYM